MSSFVTTVVMTSITVSTLYIIHSTFWCSIYQTPHLFICNRVSLIGTLTGTCTRRKHQNCQYRVVSSFNCFKKIEEFCLIMSWILTLSAFLIRKTARATTCWHQKMSRLLQLQVTLVILHLHTSNIIFCAASYIMVTFLADKRSCIAFKKNKCCLRTLLVKTRVQESIRFSCELKLFDFRLETRFMKSNAHTQKSSLLSACLPFRETIG